MRHVIRLLHVLLALASIAICSCDARRAAEKEQLARFPKGEIFEVCESLPPSIGRGIPDCLRARGAVLGRGVCVPLEERRPDGARDAPKWGQWTYEYAATIRWKAPDGTMHTRYTDLENSSLGIESRGEYRNNVPDGPWTYWHPNGRKRAVGQFSDGRMSGEWKFWLEDGTPDSTQSGVYENDVRRPATQR